MADPLTVISNIVLSFLLPFLWFLYFYKKDSNPEPFKWLLLAFISGIIATFPSLYFQEILSKIGLDKTNSNLFYFLSALSEEFFKFFVIWLFIFQKSVFDESIDAIVYMTASALGFAFFENLSLYIRVLDEPSKLIFIYPFIRFVGANFLHILASALIGFGYGEAIATRRFLPFTISFIFASLIHFWYNVIVLKTETLISVLPIFWSVFFLLLIEINHIKIVHGRKLLRK